MSFSDFCVPSNLAHHHELFVNLLLLGSRVTPTSHVSHVLEEKGLTGPEDAELVSCVTKLLNSEPITSPLGSLAVNCGGGG